MYKEIFRNKMLIVMIGFVVCGGTSKADAFKDCTDECEIAVGKERFGNPKFHECKEEERRKLAECVARQSRPTDVGTAVLNTVECASIGGKCPEGMVMPNVLRDCMCKCYAKFPSQEDFGDYQVGPQQKSFCPKEEPNSDEEKPSDQ
jgi:hypothetical protein